MKCQACKESRHWECGMQTWCECECDPEMAMLFPEFDPYDDDNPDGHSQECVCEVCIQNYPERAYLFDDGN